VPTELGECGQKEKKENAKTGEVNYKKADITNINELWERSLEKREEVKEKGGKE